jgi:CubicO group peptidase (beta-lactamase class C family)
LDAGVAFRIASVTKMITATAHLVLADQDRCRLDDPAGRHLPSGVVDRFHDRTGHAYAAAVTLRQLLDHTSGLPNFFTQPPILDAVRHGAGRRRFTPLNLVDLAAAGAPPTSPPGTARAYTDTGFVLAGLIIQALTRRPLQEAYRELVLDPAGMADTWLESSDEAPRRRDVAPHDLDGHDITGMDPTVDWAGGGLVSTAADLAAFLRALTRGQLVSAPCLERDDLVAARSGGLLRRLRPWAGSLQVPGGAGRRPPRGLGRVRVLVARARRGHHRHRQHRKGGPSRTARRGRARADRLTTPARRSPSHAASAGVEKDEMAGGAEGT